MSYTERAMTGSPAGSGLTPAHPGRCSREECCPADNLAPAYVVVRLCQSPRLPGGRSSPRLAVGSASFWLLRRLISGASVPRRAHRRWGARSTRRSASRLMALRRACKTTLGQRPRSATHPTGRWLVSPSAPGAATRTVANPAREPARRLLAALQVQRIIVAARMIAIGASPRRDGPAPGGAKRAPRCFVPGAVVGVPASPGRGPTPRETA